MKMTHDSIPDLAWDKVNGLMPCVVQDAHSAKVLMLGYMNEEALSKTLSSKQVTFFSRTKNRLWTKGETSGHVLQLVDICEDCDQDTLLAQVIPLGPTCHLGTETCWAKAQSADGSFLFELEKLLAERKNADPDSSYTAKLYQKGIKRIAQKVGEEGVETALAATAGDLEELRNESADLLYHLLVLLQASNLSLADAVAVLKERHK
ncbi:MAG: bifunctional phosphoribosyl-AMP cyclohydrolase/phosphoribosyl-ATP diphosphatase HisIE [Aestuariibacter sp.]